MFYVYTYFINDKPIYVGKGKKGRYLDHWNKIINGKSIRNKSFNSRLKRLFELNEEPIIKKIDCDSEEHAFELEEFLITEIGRLDLGNGSLSNLTNGGEGRAGSIISESHREAVRISNSTREVSDLVKNNFCKWNIGNHHSEEMKQQLSNSNKGKKRTPEQCENYKRAALNRTQEHKDNISKALKQKYSLA